MEQGSDGEVRIFPVAILKNLEKILHMFPVVIPVGGQHTGDGFRTDKRGPGKCSCMVIEKARRQNDAPMGSHISK